MGPGHQTSSRGGSQEAWVPRPTFPKINISGHNGGSTFGGTRRMSFRCYGDAGNGEEDLVDGPGGLGSDEDKDAEMMEMF
jgi:hypothetical protein